MNKTNRLIDLFDISAPYINLPRSFFYRGRPLKNNPESEQPKKQLTATKRQYPQIDQGRQKPSLLLFESGAMLFEKESSEAEIITSEHMEII